MDLDDWYDLVQEPLPSNPPEPPWRALALAAAGLVVAVAVVLGVVVLRDGDDGASDDVATLGSSLPPSGSASTSATSTSRRSRDTTSTTGSTTSTTTAPAPTVGGVTETRPADTTTAPPPPHGAAPTTTVPPPPPPPPPAPPQPAARSSGDLLVEVRLSSTDPAAGQRVVVAVHYVDEQGQLDLIDVRWGDGTPAGVRDPVPPCSEPGAPPAGPEDRTVELAHTWHSPGRYVIRVLVRTDDCVMGHEPDEVVVTGEVLVR